MIRVGPSGEAVGTTTSEQGIAACSALKRPWGEASIMDIVPRGRRQSPIHEIRISPHGAVCEVDALNYRLSMGHNILEEYAISRSGNGEQYIVGVDLRYRDIGRRDIGGKHDTVVSAIPVGVVVKPIAATVKDRVAAISPIEPISIVPFASIQLIGVCSTTQCVRTNASEQRVAARSTFERAGREASVVNVIS